MATIAWPNTQFYQPREFEAQLRPQVRISESIYTGQILTFETPFAAWVFSVTITSSRSADRAAVEALINSIRGPGNRVTMWHLMRPLPRGTLQSNTTTSASAAVGASTLAVAASTGLTLKAGDMLSVGRMALASQRALDNEASRREHGKLPDTATITAREALGWITTEGARMLKQSGRIGALGPGLQADLVLLRADALNMWPVHDPATSVVMQASLANVESVMIAGEWKKRDGRLLYPRLAERMGQLQASGERILEELGIRFH